MNPKSRAAFLFACFAFWAVSCSDSGGVAVIWTDSPEFAVYAARFNASQNLHSVDVLYREFPGTGLGEAVQSGELPDVVVGKWLSGKATRDFLLPMDRYVSDDGPIAGLFYPSLLEGGRLGDRQFLLPVSFNASFAVFARERPPDFSDPLTVGLPEMREKGAAFNAASAGAFTRMGFSPSWDDGFPLLAAELFGASFAEGDPLSWDSRALDRAMEFVHDWNAVTNSDLRAGDDFTFRYFNAPPEAMLLSGRAQIIVMDSSRFFTLDENLRSLLDFRWISAEDGSILPNPGVSYMGLVKRGGKRASTAADAFVRWFLDRETQRELLEDGLKFGRTETSFALAGGFSALRPVTEQVLPAFHPILLGHTPPAYFFSAVEALPSDWVAMRDRVVIPYLLERSRSPRGERGTPDLRTRIAEWTRLNRL